MIPKSFKKLFGEFPKTQFKTAMKNTEHFMKKGAQNEVKKKGFLGPFLVLFWGLGPKVSQGGPRESPRMPPGPKLLQNGSQNDSQIINKCCPEVFWKRFSKTHALSMFLNSSGLFLFCSDSCRGRLFVTFIQVKSQHSSTWLGGKPMVDASQMSPRCLPDVSQMPLRCLSDASQMPPESPQKTVWGPGCGNFN